MARLTLDELRSRTLGRQFPDPTGTEGRRTAIEVTMLDPYPPLADDLFTEPVRAVELALGLSVADLRVTGPLANH